MAHDHSADQTSGDTPGSGPAQLLFAVLVLKLNAASLREVLTEKVRGAGLQCLSVLHHGFNAEGGFGSGKTFVFGFLTP